jgi:two-component system heavy metal sensor histidine kinase CusS
VTWSSLRIRLGIWYAVFTVSCLSLFGLFLIVYLGHALETSRAPTMIHRSARLTAFVNSEYMRNPKQSLTEILTSFLRATPESDEIIVRSAGGDRLLFAGGGEPALSGRSLCISPCFREFRLKGHHYRSYTQHAVLAGLPVQVTVAGSIDEHYGILRTVRTSYFLFVPFLLLASLSGGYLLSSRALLPVGRMTATASRLSISDLHGRIPVPRTGDELQTLAEAWNNMLTRLQVSVERNAQFTSDASHDLRTSIAVMLASAQLALRKPRTSDQYAKILRTLISECEHTLRVLEDLLATARSGFEQHELSFEPLDLARVVRECCLLFSDKAEGKGQKMTFDLAPGAWVLGDPSLLHRLIGVLVDNAIKYTPHGGGIHAFLRHAPSGSVLEIRDTGVGIANTDIPRIFDRRFRSQSCRDNEPGTGLGLNIARWIAEAHQASLSVQSTERIGSIFKVVFPPFADA